MAPVTKRSGKTWVVVMRYAAQVRLRQAVFHWARLAVQIDRTCRGRYEALRARGPSYGRAVRSIADRLLGVACVLLQHQVLFDPNHGAPAGPQARALPQLEKGAMPSFRDARAFRGLSHPSGA